MSRSWDDDYNTVDDTSHRSASAWASSSDAYHAQFENDDSHIVRWTKRVPFEKRLKYWAIEMWKRDMAGLEKDPEKKQKLLVEADELYYKRLGLK